MQRQLPSVGRVDGIECWEEADARTFMVRGVNYMKDRRKVPSDHSIYRLIYFSRRWYQVDVQIRFAMNIILFSGLMVNSV